MGLPPPPLIYAPGWQTGPYNILQYVEYTHLKNVLKSHFLLSFKAASVLCDAQ